MLSKMSAFITLVNNASTKQKNNYNVNTIRVSLVQLYLNQYLNVLTWFIFTIVGHSYNVILEYAYIINCQERDCIMISNGNIDLIEGLSVPMKSVCGCVCVIQTVRGHRLRRVRDKIC